MIVRYDSSGRRIQSNRAWREEADALRAEVAALRAELDRRVTPPTDGAEPIGCPTPGACTAVAAVEAERDACVLRAMQSVQIAVAIRARGETT